MHFCIMRMGHGGNWADELHFYIKQQSVCANSEGSGFAYTP